MVPPVSNDHPVGTPTWPGFVGRYTREKLDVPSFVLRPPEVNMVTGSPLTSPTLTGPAEKSFWTLDRWTSTWSTRFGVATAVFCTELACHE